MQILKDCVDYRHKVCIGGHLADVGKEDACGEQGFCVAVVEKRSFMVWFVIKKKKQISNSCKQLLLKSVTVEKTNLVGQLINEPMTFF